MMRRRNSGRIARRRNNQIRRSTGNMLANRVLAGPPGTQKFQIDATFNITPNASGSWGFQINPGNIISNSAYAGLLAIYTRMRVKSYRILVLYPNAVTTTPGILKTWLSRDTTSQASLTYPVLSAQHGVKSSNMRVPHVWNWYPIETADYNFLPINQLVDSGVVYGAVSSVSPNVTPQLQIRMVVHMYAATFNSRESDVIALD